MRGMDLVGLGYCSYDILAIVDAMPAFDDVRGAHLADLVYDGGGPVGTALAAASAVSARAGYIGVLGDDQEGQFLRDLFVQDRIDVSRLRVRADVGSNVCFILVEQATGKRAILCHQRVSCDDLTLDEADRRYIQSARALHLDGQFLPAAIQAARWAREAGVKVCFDGNHPRPGLDELLPLVNWLVVAEPFPAAYTGLDDPHQAARALLATLDSLGTGLGPEVLVVTLGERGCAIWTRDEHFSVPGFSVEAVDTTGAGDAFHGGFLYAKLQGWGLHRAATFANAVAALNCQTLGGRRGLPTLAQAQALITRHNTGGLEHL